MTPDQECFREFVRTVGRGERRARALSVDDARVAMGMILDGRADREQSSAFLLALRIKGEDPGEVAGFAQAMMERCAAARNLPDTAAHAVSVGHAYDGREDTFIMGAGAAIVAAAAGARVVLHGAPSVPMKHAPTVGEVLIAMGLPAYLPPDRVGESFSRCGFVHCSTPDFLPAWSAQLEVREKIGLRLPFSTVEKLLDPLRTGNLIVGIAHGPYLARIAGAFRRLNVRQGLVVQGLEGSCDLSPQHPTRAAEAWPDPNPDAAAREISVDPAQLGIAAAAALDVRAVGADPLGAAELTKRALEPGRRGDGESRAAAEALALNAAILLWRAGVTPDIPAALQRARETIASGAAHERMIAAK